MRILRPSACHVPSHRDPRTGHPMLQARSSPLRARRSALWLASATRVVRFRHHVWGSMKKLTDILRGYVDPKTAHLHVRPLGRGGLSGSIAEIR